MKEKRREKVLAGDTHEINTSCGSLLVTVNKSEGKVFEVFARLGKAGGCPSCQLEALARSISTGLRAGVELEEYAHTLIGLRCHQPSFSNGDQINSCPDAIAQVLKLYTGEATVA